MYINYKQNIYQEEKYKYNLLFNLFRKLQNTELVITRRGEGKLPHICEAENEYNILREGLQN